MVGARGFEPPASSSQSIRLMSNIKAVWRSSRPVPGHVIQWLGGKVPNFYRYYKAILMLDTMISFRKSVRALHPD